MGGAIAEINRRNETNLVGIMHDSMYKYMYVALELMLTPLPRYLMPIAFLHRYKLFGSYLVTELYKVPLSCMKYMYHSSSLYNL